MAVTFNSNLIGTFKAVGKDEKLQKVKIEIRQGNTLATMIYKAQDQETGKFGWYLYSFFGDEEHLKAIEKGNNGNPFFDKVEDIRLNTYYPEAKTLLDHFTRAGYIVKCYYQTPKNK